MAKKLHRVSTTRTTTAATSETSVKQNVDTYESNNKALFKSIAKKAALDALQLIDLTKTESRSYSTFSKNTLRTYSRNVMSYQAEIRQLSQYLYRVSNPYRRLIWYNATMFMANAREVIPDISLIDGENNDDEILKNYYDTLTNLEKMNIQNEITKMLVIAWREDTSYGTVYSDDKNSFILPFDGDYAKVSSINFDGSLNWACDLSYFRSRQEQLEYYGEPFKSMYTKYENDSTMRWQEVDPSISFCIKVNIDDPTLPLPPYFNLFNSIIDLADLQDIQKLKDEQSIYKLLVASLEPMSNSEIPDEFKVDPDTAIKYYNRMVDSLPSWIGSAISPMPLEILDVYNSETNDVNKIADATKNLFNNSGGAQVLNSASISGTTAWSGAIKADESYALSILPQIEIFINKWLTTIMGDHAKVKYKKCSTYTVQEYKRSIKDDACYGEPNRLLINSLNGINELDTISMRYLEENILNLTTLIPMQSSYNQSGDSISNLVSGGQEKDSSDLTDDGEASIDKRDNAK